MAKKQKLILTIDTIPPNNWGENLHEHLPSEVWDALRKEVYAFYDWKCMICGASDVQLHCHEEWLIKDKSYKQYLLGFMCLCPDCHSIKHWGRTSVLYQQGKISKRELDRLVAHFCRVNEVGIPQLGIHLEHAKARAKIRARYHYKLIWGKFSPERILAVWKEMPKGKGQTLFPA